MTADEYCGCDDFNKNYCKLVVKDYLDIKKIILSRYNMAELKNNINDLLRKEEIDRGMVDYIRYIPTFDTEQQTAFAKYKNYKRLILEFNDGTYASIEVDNESHEEDEG